MRWSRFGRAWRACADDAGAAALFGVDRGRVLLATFALASVLAGLAGYVMTVYYGTVGYAGGIVLGLKALLAAVAGGIGSVPGAFLGGILLGCSEALWSALFPIEFRDLAVFMPARGAAGRCAPAACSASPSRCRASCDIVISLSRFSRGEGLPAFTQIDSTSSQRVIQEPSVRVIRGGGDGSRQGGAW